MKTFSAIILAAVIAFTQVSCVPSGAAAGMDLDLVKNVKNYVMPFIIKNINALKLGRIDYNGGYVENLDINFNLKSNDSVQFTFDPVQNAVVLNAKDISGYIQGNFKQRLLLVSATGKFKASFKDGGISFQAVIPVHTQVVNGRKIPNIEFSKFKITFDTWKISISIWGGFLADIGNLFIGLFKGLIIGDIGKSINNELPGQINAAIKTALVASDGVLPLGDGIGFDFQFPADPIITNSTLGLYLNATFFNASKGYKYPQSPITDMKLNFSTSNIVLIDASRYTIDSVFMTLHDANALNLTIDKDLVGPEVAEQFLNTTFLDALLPGLINKFGRDQPISFNYATRIAPTSYFKPGQLGMMVTADLTIFVNDDVAAIIEVINSDGSISVSLDNFILKIDLLNLYLNDATLIKSNIGSINTWILRTFVNTFFRFFIPVVNSYLQPGIPIPQEFFNMVRIRSASFEAMDGFVQVAISPEFI